MAAPTNRWRSQHGMTLVECVVSVAISSLIAAGVCQTLLAYQSGYHRQTTRVDRDQQARFALDLMVEEARVAERVARGPGCAEPGLHLDDARLSFAANLYERTTVLREPVSSGRRSMVVAAGALLDHRDRILLIGIGDPADPSDDVAECLKVAGRAGDQVDLETPLIHSYPTGTRISVSNQVTYTLDARRGRLMRAQDGASQRVAQDVAAFSARVEGAAIVLRLEMRAKPGDAPAAWRRLMTAHP
ncbi:MAG: prepilin-type N-terminal cleavage/methylation domain-containing protein [Nitrospiria bacterium]